MSWGKQCMGIVVEFDLDRCLGVVQGDEGDRFAFHGTALIDGTRNVAIGTKVRFVTAPGHLGKLEARDLTATV